MSDQQPQPEPWPSPGPLFDSVEWCDACGEPIASGERCTVAAMPCDCAAANAGESATLCRPCWASVREIGGRA